MNYSNLFLQSLVEANEREQKQKKEERRLKQEAEEIAEDDAALEEKPEADANAEEAIEALGEPSEEELDAAEQEELEARAQDVESLEDPMEYDVDPDENEISDDELEALEAEAEDPEPAPEEIPQGEIPQEGDFQDYTASDDQMAAAQGPVQSDVPMDDGEVPDFDYDTPASEGAPPAEEPVDPNADPANAPADGEQPPADGADPNAAADVPPDPETQNIQVNILNLSKLDRALAKKHIYSLFMDLRASITTALNVISRNETVIDPEVRDTAITKFNDMASDLSTFISIKFQLVNYEAALQSYMLFTEQFNQLIEFVKSGSQGDGNHKHKNKGD